MCNRYVKLCKLYNTFFANLIIHALGYLLENRCFITSGPTFFSIFSISAHYTLFKWATTNKTKYQYIDNYFICNRNNINIQCDYTNTIQHMLMTTNKYKMSKFFDLYRNTFLDYGSNLFQKIHLITFYIEFYSIFNITKCILLTKWKGH